jgi:hypothetical protein
MPKQEADLENAAPQQQENKKQRKGIDWDVLRYHVGRSTYITLAWDWFVGLATKAAEPVLFVSVLYFGAKMLPGMPKTLIPWDSIVFIAQQIALDIGGMGLIKLAQQAREERNRKGGTLAMVVGIALLLLMMTSLVVSSISQLFKLDNLVYMTIETILLIARAVLAVLYGVVIHSLKGEDQGATKVISVRKVQSHLDTWQEQLTLLDTRITQKIDSLMGHVATQIDTLNRQVAARLDTLSTQEEMQLLDTQITRKVDTLATGTATQIDTLSRQVTTLGEAFANLSSLLSTVEDRMQTIGARITLVEQSQEQQLQQIAVRVEAGLEAMQGALLKQVQSLQLPAAGNTNRKNRHPHAAKIDTSSDHLLDTQEKKSNTRESEIDTPKIDTPKHEIDTPKIDSSKIIHLSNGSGGSVKQTEVMDFITAYLDTQRREPTLSEIINQTGCSKQTAVNARQAVREMRRSEEEQQEQSVNL